MAKHDSEFKHQVHHYYCILVLFWFGNVLVVNF
jgi:hypothetical protein